MGKAEGNQLREAARRGPMQAFKHSSLIKKATKDDDEPVPGYLFHEVKQATDSSQEACKRIQDYLLDRLDHKSPLVKWKALRVIRHVAEKGQIDFKRGMQRNQDKFREAAHYRGEPDPLHGDAFNTRVRETAAVTKPHSRLVWCSRLIPGWCAGRAELPTPDRVAQLWGKFRTKPCWFRRW